MKARTVVSSFLWYPWCPHSVVGSQYFNLTDGEKMYRSFLLMVKCSTKTLWCHSDVIRSFNFFPFFPESYFQLDSSPYWWSAWLGQENGGERWAPVTAQRSPSSKKDFLAQFPPLELQEEFQGLP